MPVKFTEVLKKMVEQSGVSVTDATMKSILENTALSNIEVADDVSSKLTAERFTLDAAKQNPDLHKHFKAAILDGADKEVYRIADEYGLSDEDKTLLKSSENSYKRIAEIAKLVKTAEAKKTAAPGKEKDALTKEIEKLNAEMLTLKDTYSKQQKDQADSFDNERNNWKMESVYNEFIPQMDKKYSHDINLTIARTQVAKELQKKGLKVVNKDGSLSLFTGQDTEYYENNQKVDLKDFVNKTLANEKLLIASPVQRPANNKDNRSNRDNSQNNGTELNGSKYLAALEED